MKVWVAGLFVIAVATAVSGLMCWIEWLHHPQGEIIGDGTIDDRYLVTLFGAWWIFSLGAMAPFFAAWIFLRKKRS